MIDFTTTIAIDDIHVRELYHSFPTWRAFKPEIFQRPMIVLYDTTPTMEVAKDFIDHPDVAYVRVAAHVGIPQREKMLAALAFAPRFAGIKTPWFLKLDVDAVATATNRNWIDDAWFTDSPAFVSNGWGYTKPGGWIGTLDDWADGIKMPGNRMNIALPNETRAVRHKRIISWLYFGRTDWHREVCGLYGERLPVPSHDTANWYVAHRRRDHYRRVRFASLGWRHIGSGINSIRHVARLALAETSAA